MSNPPTENDDMPDEIDFSGGVRGLHHIPPPRKGLFTRFHRAERVGILLWKGPTKGYGPLELLTEVLQRGIEINEALQ